MNNTNYHADDHDHNSPENTERCGDCNERWVGFAQTCPCCRGAYIVTLRRGL